MSSDSMQMCSDDEDDVPLNKLRRYRKDAVETEPCSILDFTKQTDVFSNIFQHAESSSDSVAWLCSMKSLCKHSKVIVDDIMKVSPEIEPEEGLHRKQDYTPRWLAALRTRATLITDDEIRKKIFYYNLNDDRLLENSTRMSAFNILQSMYTEEKLVEKVFEHLHFVGNIPNMLAAIQDGIDKGIVAPATDLLSICIKAMRCHIHNSGIFKNGCIIMVAIYRYNGWHNIHTAAAVLMLAEGFRQHQKNISVALHVMCQISYEAGDEESVICSMEGLTLQHHQRLTEALCGIMDFCVEQKENKDHKTDQVMRAKRAHLIEVTCKVMATLWCCEQSEYYRSAVFGRSLQTFNNIISSFEGPELNDAIILALDGLLDTASRTDPQTNLQTVEMLMSTNLVSHVCKYWKDSPTRKNDLAMLSVIYEVIMCVGKVPEHNEMIRHCLMRGLAISQSSIRVYEFHYSETFVAEALGLFLRDAYQRPAEQTQKFVVRQGLITICIAMIGEMTSSRRDRDGNIADSDQKKTRHWVQLLSLAVMDKRKYQTRLINMDGLELLHNLVNTEEGLQSTPLELCACTLMSYLVMENFDMIRASIFNRSIPKVARAIVYASSRGRGVEFEEAILCVRTLDFLHGKISLEHAVTLRSFSTMANFLKTHCTKDSVDVCVLQKKIIAYVFRVLDKDSHHALYKQENFDNSIFVFPTHPTLENDQQYQMHLQAIKMYWE
jgi:hypothetical protein